jgi:hypothetical protein
MSGFQYLPEEQEGQFRTDEQAVPSTEYARDEKTFDAAHPQVAQMPANKAQVIRWHQQRQARTDEQEDPTKAAHDAYPTDI